MTVQVVRDPPQFASSEWSEYIRVHGITTLPPVPTPPPTDGIVPERHAGLSMTELIIMICVIAGVVAIVIVVIAILVIVCCVRK